MKMSWYSACLLLLFLFRTNGKKENLDENGFRHCNGTFFRKWHSESYLITAMFKVPSQEIRGTLTIAFWKIPYSSLFYGHGSTCVQDFRKRYWNENRWRYTQNVHLEEHCSKIATTFHLFNALIFLTNLVFKFNIVLTDLYFDNVNHNLYH